VPAERAQEYAAYLDEAGIRALADVALGVEQYRRDIGETAEFVTISYWESVEAMARYTGGDPSVVHHLPRDAEFLVELPPAVEVLHLVSARWAAGGQGHSA
jgi:heme-degrading monooxygenase HmoA